MNLVFLKQGGSGSFVFSISAKSDNFEVLTLLSAEQKISAPSATLCLDLGKKFFLNINLYTKRQLWVNLSASSSKILKKETPYSTYTLLRMHHAFMQ